MKNERNQPDAVDHLVCAIETWDRSQDAVHYPASCRKKVGFALQSCAEFWQGIHVVA